ncbi:MAG: acetate kinase [Oscillospiraceae bacterium]|nr:acetate kinase [Oscillospiraceae bacterium]
MKILVLNAGSSSLKYQLFDMRDNSVLAKGLCERIGICGSKIKHTAESPRRIRDTEVQMDDHQQAISVLLDMLTDSEVGVISSMTEIDAVGHRVVHGEELFSKSSLINDEVLAAIELCCALAPLHNPPNLIGIRACMALMPNIPQVAVFDTAFHQTMPNYAFLYSIPYEYYTRNKIRRYGFHGTSHRYVSSRAAQMLNRPVEELRIITCHLGNGSSVAAIRNGCSVDTTMGFTPLEGLPMGTRSGSIDPAILSYLMEKENLSSDEMLNVLNKKSGMLGLSGISSDFRDLANAAKEGNDRADIALKVFNYSVKKYVGGYSAVLGGVDALVFTAGVGENSPAIRAAIAGGLDYMGLSLDSDKNEAARGVEADISASGSRGRILVIPTNEELVIAKDTEALIKR